MSIIPLPTGYTFSSVEWAFDVPGQVNRSEWTGRRTFLRLPGAERWYAKATVDAIATEADERKWRSFLMQMRGRQNVVNVPALGDAVGVQKLGDPIAAAIPAGSRTASLSGMPPGPYLPEGAYMSLVVSGDGAARQLVVLTADLVANASGNGTASFEPAVRGTNGSPAFVEVRRPYCPMTLVSSRNGWSTSGGVSSFVLDLEEAL